MIELTKSQDNEAIMIYDILENSSLYEGIHPRLKQAFSYLNSNDLFALQPGRIDLDGDSLYVLVQEYSTKLLDEGKWESHRRYFDVQYMLDGCERIDFALLNTMSLGEYNPEKDFQAMSGNGQTLYLCAGSYAIFFPQDSHKPGLTTGVLTPVKKIVLKCEL
jgi:YhcH/YjgK/YiaL family protein